MPKIHRIFRALALPWLVAACGCSSGDGRDLRAISGQVSFEGVPIESGAIHFMPERGTPEGATIEHGRYATRVSPGRNVVKVFGSRPHPTKTVPDADPARPPVPLMEDFIPKQFNDHSTLSVVVEKNGEVHDLHLKR